MKKIFFILCILFFGLTLEIKAQCFADAGKNTLICTGDTILLGDSPTASGGSGSYTYSWSCKYIVYLIDTNLVYTASDFLDDTTLANPRLIWAPEYPETVTFTVEITDSVGNVCTDSITVGSSQFVVCAMNLEAYINKGDSVMLYSCISGGVPPFTYQWTPIIGLTDPNDVNTYASPDTTTIYLLTVIDSIGCQMGSGFSVSVLPTSIDDEYRKHFNFQIYPNPLTNFSIVSFDNSSNKEHELIIYDIYGKELKRFYTTSKQIYLTLSELNNGLYFYKFLKENELLLIGKLVIDY